MFTKQSRETEKIKKNQKNKEKPTQFGEKTTIPQKKIIL